MSRWPVHPAEAAFPEQTEEEFHVLLEDIRAHGQLIPVVICQDTEFRNMIGPFRTYIFLCETASGAGELVWTHANGPELDDVLVEGIESCTRHKTWPLSVCLVGAIENIETRWLQQPLGMVHSLDGIRQAAHQASLEKTTVIINRGTRTIELIGGPASQYVPGFVELGKYTFDDYLQLVQAAVREADAKARECARDGYVYCARSGGKIKIGFSTAPEARIEQLATGNPDIELLGYIPGTIKLETALHKRFAKSRVAGEWFTLSKEVSLWVDKVSGKFGEE